MVGTVKKEVSTIDIVVPLREERTLEAENDAVVVGVEGTKNGVSYPAFKETVSNNVPAKPMVFYLKDSGKGIFKVGHPRTIGIIEEKKDPIKVVVCESIEPFVSWMVFHPETIGVVMSNFEVVYRAKDFLPTPKAKI